jgi:hypothetical protein
MRTAIVALSLSCITPAFAQQPAAPSPILQACQAALLDQLSKAISYDAQVRELTIRLQQQEKKEAPATEQQPSGKSD